MECAGKCSTGKGEHGPADPDSDQEKKEERPEDVFDAVFGAAATEESKGDRDDHGEEKKCLEVRELERRYGGHALCPRAAS